jgi:hypothetical protein
VEDQITYSHEQDGSLITSCFECSNCTGEWEIPEWEESAVRIWCPFCGITAHPDRK